MVALTHASYRRSPAVPRRRFGRFGRFGGFGGFGSFGVFGGQIAAKSGNVTIELAHPGLASVSSDKGVDRFLRCEGQR